MAITVNWDRRKKDLTLAQTSNATQQNPEEGTLQWYSAITIDAVVLDSISEDNCDAASGAAIITKSSGTFGDVRPGDLVTGDANIPAGAYVISKDSDTQVTISAVTTGAVSGATLIFNDAGSKTLNLCVLASEVTITPGKDTWSITPIFYLFDGTNAADANNDNTDDNTLLANKANAKQIIKLSSQQQDRIPVNIDEILLNARNDRANS